MDERAAGKRDGDVRADRHVIGRVRGDDARQVGIVAGLGGPETVVSELFRLRRETPRIAEIVGEQAAVDLHGGCLLEPRPRGQGIATARLVAGASSVVARRPWTLAPPTAARSMRSA